MSFLRGRQVAEGCLRKMWGEAGQEWQRNVSFSELPGPLQTEGENTIVCFVSLCRTRQLQLVSNVAFCKHL